MSDTDSKEQARNDVSVTTACLISTNSEIVRSQGSYMQLVCSLLYYKHLALYTRVRESDLLSPSLKLVLTWEHLMLRNGGMQHRFHTFSILLASTVGT